MLLSRGLMELQILIWLVGHNIILILILVAKQFYSSSDISFGSCNFLSVYEKIGESRIDVADGSPL